MTPAPPPLSIVTRIAPISFEELLRTQAVERMKRDPNLKTFQDALDVLRAELGQKETP